MFLSFPYCCLLNTFNFSLPHVRPNCVDEDAWIQKWPYVELGKHRYNNNRRPLHTTTTTTITTSTTITTIIHYYSIFYGVRSPSLPWCFSASHVADVSEFCCSAALLAHDRSKKTDVGRSSNMLSDLFFWRRVRNMFLEFFDSLCHCILLFSSVASTRPLH